MSHREIDKNMVSTNGGPKEWRAPVLRKLPIAETSNVVGKIHPGNEGVGGGKGDNATIIS
jgi:hypothetical protein